MWDTDFRRQVGRYQHHPDASYSVYKGSYPEIPRNPGIGHGFYFGQNHAGQGVGFGRSPDMGQDYYYGHMGRDVPMRPRSMDAQNFAYYGPSANRTVLDQNVNMVQSSAFGQNRTYGAGGGMAQSPAFGRKCTCGAGGGMAQSPAFNQNHTYGAGGGMAQSPRYAQGGHRGRDRREGGGRDGRERGGRDRRDGGGRNGRDGGGRDRRDGGGRDGRDGGGRDGRDGGGRDRRDGGGRDGREGDGKDGINIARTIIRVLCKCFSGGDDDGDGGLNLDGFLDTVGNIGEFFDDDE